MILSIIRTNFNLPNFTFDQFSVSRKLIGGAIRPRDLLFYCIPRTNVHTGYGLVVVTPPHPQTCHRSHDNLINPDRIASICCM